MNKHEGGGNSHRRPLAKKLVRAAEKSYDCNSSIGEPSSYGSHRSLDSVGGHFFGKYEDAKPMSSIAEKYLKKEKEESDDIDDIDVDLPITSGDASSFQQKGEKPTSKETDSKNYDVYSEGFGCRMDYLPHVVIEEESHAQWYINTSGIQTVAKWLFNYNKHPAG